MNLKYFSQFYNIPTAENEDWFDPQMSSDTLLFIDPFLVFETDIPLFSNAKEKFFDFFNCAFELAHEAVSSITAYNKLKAVLKFPEVKELCLGFSQGGTAGSGSGGGYSKGFADALVQLASAGHTGLDHFEEIEIFTVGIGKDRISDATANLIKPELIEYTQQVCKTFNISTISHIIENAGFDYQYKRWDKGRAYSLPGNPFFNRGERAVILVPKAFICATHAIGSDGFKNYVKDYKNEELRADLNYEIEKEFREFKKSDIVNLSKRYPGWVREYIDYIENDADIKPYDLEVDTENLYRNEKRAYSFIISHPIEVSVSNDEEFVHWLELLLDRFRFFIEEQDGNKLLWTMVKKPFSQIVDCQPCKEYTARSVLGDIILGYCHINKVNISKESDLGKRIVEFSFSSGYKNQALIELKLAKNIQKLIQDDLEKLSGYIRSYKTNYRYFLVIPYTRKELEYINKAISKIESIDFGELSFKFSVVDATLDQPNTPVVPSQSQQMLNDRLCTVEENLELLRKQIAGKEKAKILAPFEEHTRIELGIQELRKQMRTFEEEYWQLLATRSTQVEIAEPEAEIVVAELVEQVGQLQTSSQYPDEVLQLLQKIYIEVSKPGTPAAAKLKAAVSMFPPFVSLAYEAEIDTENFFRTHLPTFTKCYKALAKK
ncbi:hypothetical protein [Coleofasciculus sp. FACHB-501]|uniref:hypothetical protein n=1 Tax=Cyanophyceae TaxID=3028117 RepID=UPI001F554C0B|nr:hypothetical protein [Coleofasciculus sp. FACHB-501]